MAAPELPKINADSLKQSVVTPGYLLYRPDGVFISLQNSFSAGNFESFVNNLFSADSRFAGLDYDIFLKLLYDADWLLSTSSKSSEVKIAASIVHFPSHRRELYRPVKVLDRGKQAEYVFEPVTVTVPYEEPVYGEPGVDGDVSVINQTGQTREQVANLEFDEFVAAMWAKGVKYGINVEVVRKIIAESSTIRMIVANYLPPTEGCDAYIQEISPDLHRDNSPKTLSNGKTDLRAFQNRFPQVSKGTRLLKKVPREFGKRGYKVTGETIDPPDPQELNLLALTSNGTEIIQDNGVDYIVAQMDGFLTIDPLLNLISINEKIETTAGVSMKTTGDLMLGVEEFVEHGEVQEGRVVKGKHMTFKSNVFGNLLSSGGNIVVQGNLSGGGAETTGGDITLGRASRAIVRSHDGDVNAKYCENCTIIGKTIHVEHAVNCELVANEIYAESVEGCLIAAESIKVLSSSESKNRETLITMVIPDLSEFEKSITNLNAKIADCQTNIQSRCHDIEVLKSDQDFAKFLALSERIKSGEIKLTSEQAGNWQKLVTKNATGSGQVNALNKQILALEGLIMELNESLVKISKELESTGTGIHCVIDNVIGLTTGQTMTSVSGMTVFNSMPESDAKILLQKVDQNRKRIFSEDEGTINWSYK